MKIVLLSIAVLTGIQAFASQNYESIVEERDRREASRVCANFDRDAAIAIYDQMNNATNALLKDMTARRNFELAREKAQSAGNDNIDELIRLSNIAAQQGMLTDEEVKQVSAIYKLLTPVRAYKTKEAFLYANSNAGSRDRCEQSSQALESLKAQLNIK